MYKWKHNSSATWHQSYREIINVSIRVIRMPIVHKYALGSQIYNFCRILNSDGNPFKPIDSLPCLYWNIYRMSSKSTLGENIKLLATVKYNQSHDYYDENKMTVYREIRDCPDSNLYPSIRLSCSNFGKYFSNIIEVYTFLDPWLVRSSFYFYLADKVSWWYKNTGWLYFYSMETALKQ